MGNRKKSAQQQINEGDPSRRGIRKLDEALAREPKTQSGLLPVPSRLKGDSRALYSFFAEQLELSGLDAKPDGPALAAACTSLALAWKADARLQREGAVVKVPIFAGVGRARKVVGHRQVRSRWFGVKVEAQKEFRNFASSFGLVGPASRANLEVDSGQDAHERLMELISGPYIPLRDRTAVTPEEPTQ